MKMLKTFTSLVVISSLVLSLAACGSTPGKSTNNTTTATTENASKKNPEVTLSLLTTQARMNDGMKAMGEMVKKDANITVDFQVVPDAQVNNLILTKIASGNEPDIYDSNSNGGFTLGGDLTQKIVDLSNESWVSRLSNAAPNKKDGKIWSFPREGTTGLIAAYYNKKVFTELGLTEPNTYSDFLALLEKVKNSGKDIVPIYQPCKDSWVPQIFATAGFAAAIHPNEKEIFDKINSNKLKFAAVPEFKEVLQKLADLSNKGYFNKDMFSATYDMSKEAVATGKALMSISAEFFVTDIAKKYPDVELGAFLIPFNNKKELITGGYCKAMVIFKNSKNIDAAKKLFSIWSTPKYMEDIYYAASPSLSAFTDMTGGKLPPAVKKLVDTYVVTGKSYPEGNSYQVDAGSSMGDYWTGIIEIMAGKKTPEQVLTKYDIDYSAQLKSLGRSGF